MIEIGSRIGSLMTIAIIILTAAAGAFLLRIQGISTVAKIQNHLHQGQLPAVELVEGAILLICGALLLTPGFFTDTIGFLCLVPAFRTNLAKLLIRTLLRKRQQRAHQNDSNVIDAEYWTDSEDRIDRDQ